VFAKKDQKKYMENFLDLGTTFGFDAPPLKKNRNFGVKLMKAFVLWGFMKMAVATEEGGDTCARTPTPHPP
jgi:hypothetical protein